MARKMTKFYAWSFSRLHDHDDCPFYAKCKYLDKLQEPESPALLRGSKVHSDAQAFVEGRRKTVPSELKSIAPRLRKLKKLRPATEKQLAVTADWRTSDWFGYDTWLRAVLDVAYVTDENVLKIIDYKTGKERDYHKDQAEIFALVSLAHWPEVDAVDVEFWYVDSPDGLAPVYSYNRKLDEQRLRKRWIKRSRPMLVAKAFKATPSRKCNWCPYSKNKNGPCQY